VIQILGRPNSVNVQKVMWCAAEIGIPVDRHDIGGAFGGNTTDDYLAKNPNGRVPTLIDGEFVLWESNAIVRYLSEAYGKAPWFPESAQERGLCNQWMDWYLTTLHAPMTVIFWQLIRTIPEHRDHAAIDAAVVEANVAWAILDKHLEHNAFVLGENLTMGDVPLGCAVNRWHTLDVERPNLPRLEAYYQRLQERPHFREHVMVTME